MILGELFVSLNIHLVSQRSVGFYPALNTKLKYYERRFSLERSEELNKTIVAFQ